MVDPELDRVLFNRLRAGDMTACDECVTLHSPGLHRLAFRLVGDEVEAEDIVQETFLNAFQAINTFDGRSTLGTWLYRITYNLALMHLRRRKVERMTTDGTDNTDKLRFFYPCPSVKSVANSSPKLHSSYSRPAKGGSTTFVVALLISPPPPHRQLTTGNSPPTPSSCHSLFTGC